MRELWWMARAAWKQTAMLASIMAVPAEDQEPFEPDDFNPFYAGREKQRTKAVEPYDPQLLQYYQDSLVSTS